MLILWRRSGQSLIVGDGIEIQVLDAGPNRVKLGIVAPAAVPVYRKEAQATREHNIAAAASADRKTMEKLVRMAGAACVPAVSAGPRVKELTVAGQSLRQEKNEKG